MTATSPALPKYHDSKGALLKVPNVNDPEQWEEDASLLGRIYPGGQEAKLSVVFHSRTLELRRFKYISVNEGVNAGAGLVGYIRSYIHKKFKDIVCKVVMLYGNSEPHLVSFGDKDHKTLLMRDGVNVYKADAANVVAIGPDGSGVTIALFDVEGSNRKELSVTHVARLKPPALPPRK